MNEAEEAWFVGSVEPIGVRFLATNVGLGVGFLRKRSFLEAEGSVNRWLKDQ